jgi:hypothetical protein
LEFINRNALRSSQATNVLNFRRCFVRIDVDGLDRLAARNSQPDEFNAFYDIDLLIPSRRALREEAPKSLDPIVARCECSGQFVASAAAASAA